MAYRAERAKHTHGAHTHMQHTERGEMANQTSISAKVSDPLRKRDTESLPYIQKTE